ncbi:MAG TPA: leucyl aminopeptidase [Vicinamibacterales bacterium]|nr:leucyl aminopeptidase [Vicinamibacterales bacterium]
MSAPSPRPPIACRFGSLPSVDVDMIVLPWFEGEGLAAFESLDVATSGEIARALSTHEFTGAPFEIFITPLVDRAWLPRRVALIGAGREGAFAPGVARRLGTAAGLAGRSRKVSRLALVMRPGQAAPSGDVDVAGFVQAMAEGLTLAEFTGTTHQTGESREGIAPAFTIVVPDLADTSPESPGRLEGAVARGRVLGEATNFARALTNEPGNHLTPREFAARATGIASAGGVTTEVLDEQQIEALGMRMLLGVARGSSEPPRLMVFRHNPPEVTTGPVLALVGKGITFDSGGISIKSADGMEKMKDDMAGGAAVACAMRAIATLNAPIRVIGVVPATENMPGGRALKPGDVLRSAEGKTVEVINTDAEGRLVLGDALWYARQQGATHLVDVATLTGGILVALGRVTSGLFGTPDWWVEQVRRVGDRAGDRMWQMPLFEDYRDQLKSEIADMINSAGRMASSVTAAMFLKEFTGGLPWAHIDIAGTSWADDEKPYLPKGPTGVGVRTLIELAFSSDAWRR